MRAVFARVRPWTTFDFLIIFAFAALLVAPWFRAKYLDLWSSIESTFIADARFLAENWPHPEWQPNWYCGTRTDYIYPPAIRYGTAALIRYVPRLLPVKAYHIYVAFFYCFGIAAVYLLAARSTGSRLAGYLAAIATALISPSFLLVDYIREDSPWLMPFRLHVLLHYGEGPHMTAVAWLPLALLFSIRGLERSRPVAIALAGICCAMIVANNFYGATSLAILYPILVWAAFAGTRDWRVFGRAALIILISYGLTATWLSPGYLQVTLRNMQYVSKPGNTWSICLGAAFVVIFAVLAWRLTARRAEQIYLTFLCGATGAFLLNTVGNHYFSFRIIGEPARLFPELDLLIILLAVELLRRIWSRSWNNVALVRAGIVLIVFLSLAPCWAYVKNSRHAFVPEQSLAQRPEYTIAQWMSEHMRESRSVPAGTIRFWYDAWDDLPQLTGGSDQGILNPHIVPPRWEIYMAPDPKLSILWMQILGVDAVIVSDKTSSQPYKDYLFPEKFVGELPILFDNGRGDRIFGVPRRFPGLARVVNQTEHDALPSIPNNGELNALRAWHHNVEAGPNSPAVLKWRGPDRFVVHASLRAGESIWVAESFDPNWRATTRDGRSIPISEDKLGFMVAAVPAGDQEVQFSFPMPISRRIGWIVTLLTLVLVVSLLYAGLANETVEGM